MLLLGRKLSSRLICSMQSSSVSQANWATPLLALWAMAPPRSSWLISSPVTLLITSGPVMNM